MAASGRKFKGKRALIAAAAALAIVTAAVLVFGLARFAFCAPRDATWLRDVPIAHRGLHTESMFENSPGAFQNAMDSGYAIELDVRLTADNIPAVIHDATLRRLDGTSREVSRMTMEELEAVTLPGSGGRIPSLSQVLGLVGGRVPLLIEIKNDGRPGALEDAVYGALKGYAGDYALQSFNPAVCRYYSRLDPGAAVGLLLGGGGQFNSPFFRTLRDNLYTLACRPAFIAYDMGLVSPGMLDIYRNVGVPVLGYTYKTADPHSLASAGTVSGFDNVIFELR